MPKVSRHHSVDAFTQPNRSECNTGTAGQECAPEFPFVIGSFAGHERFTSKEIS
jgi:hypothetical protein